MRFYRFALSSWILMIALLAASSGLAADICGETVPTNRFIDGIPAYAQCTASTNSAVYSDNGIDTSTTSGGTGWVRTQYSGGYQCTELAHRYLYFKWNVQSVPNGNAGTWCDGTLPTGLVKATPPVHGDILVLAPGSCGADATTGHVALVDTVAADSLSVTALQQNSAGRSNFKMTCAACFLHATANNGAAVDGGVTDTGAVDDTGGNADTSKIDAVGRKDANLPGTGGTVATGGTAGSSSPDGAIGSGGAMGSGGVMASGGAVGSGGAAGVGGTTDGMTGAGGQMVAGSATGAPSASGSNGCSCRLGEDTGPQEYLPRVFVALVLGLLVLARRRRPPGRSRYESARR